MKQQNIKEDKTIRIIFPTKKFKKYLEKSGVSSTKELSLDLIHNVFVETIGDFRKGELSLDELSGISNHLWSDGISDKDKFNSDLAKTLYSAAELSFYVRNVQDKDAAKRFIEFLREVLSYTSSNI
ncbi:MAG: hypothetical protein A2694_02725 [Candidatus Blackburnbacteria bacterium RIFCSPHIGHO2_01_FULL_40_17]|uniref:Uncharacterized protein n=1 Tax=Candidatus Blackburnbacteria bacterium RIFCSPLOWO2_01_FULL_40_20 TaxID=1797519 RepID=A0A1G1VB30_9BACT|nr:MAG: hypothetical protein UT38_C0002G0005 [Microgenomates group bacterium GW2011_GWA2_39_19]OGY07336.1 MAG: hypothetical protein A2694_02725 [Candidatus Blackburnbacteria bacterium RIFCSPHIGHO2_01_FULL_40_17]OGY12481.1 MAG: hypothetical protein A3A77_00705 [Candidatus Blackburnbacteria bacterium RIFCSPLOWO2_01_FULL_40_20]